MHFGPDGRTSDTHHWQQLYPVLLHQRGCWVPDSNKIIHLHAVSLAALGCRYWAAYIGPSASLADGLSECSWDCLVAASLNARVYRCALLPLATFGLQAWKASQLQLFLLHPYPWSLIRTCRDCSQLAAAAVLWGWELPEQRGILRAESFCPRWTARSKPHLGVSVQDSPVTSVLSRAVTCCWLIRDLFRQKETHNTLGLLICFRVLQSHALLCLYDDGALLWRRWGEGLTLWRTAVFQHASERFSQKHSSRVLPQSRHWREVSLCSCLQRASCTSLFRTMCNTHLRGRHCSRRVDRVF